MKKFFTLLIAGILMLSGTVLAQDLFISEVADPGDQYKGRFVEIFNPTASDIDLAAGNYTLVRQANGSGIANISLTGTIEAGTAYVIATNATDFETIYGFAPDQASGSVTGSGDDGYFLFTGDYATGTLLDIYGVIDQDGTGFDWEYLDSRASRKYGINSPNTTWTASEWKIEPADAADMDPGVHAPVADVIPPVWSATYPKAINILETGFDIAAMLDETSTVYYVVMVSGGSAPSVSEVMAGTGPLGVPAVVSGNFSSGTSETTEVLTGLTADVTYSVYLVAEDGESTPNVQDAVATFDVTPTVPPVVLMKADFASDLSPFTAVSVTGNKGWYQSSGYAKMSAYVSSGVSETSEDWLISAGIDLAAATDEVLSFETANNYGDATTTLKVKISSDFNGVYDPTNVAAATWEDITDLFTLSSGGSWTFVASGEVDFTPYAVDGTGYLAFVYEYPGTTDAGTWEVDNVLYTGYLVPGADATLSDLLVDGTTIVGFDAAVLSYTVEMSAGSTVVPTVTFTKADENATVVLTPAADLAGDAAARTTTIEVTAQDGQTVATYTILFNPVIEVSDLAALRAATDLDRKYTVTGEVVLTNKDGYKNKKYFEDASAAIEIFDEDGVITTTYNIGDGVTGLTGEISEYYGMLELVPTVDPGAASSNDNAVEPQVLAVSEFVTNHENYEAEFVKIIGVTFTDAGGTFEDGKNYVVSVGQDNTVFRTNFYGVLSSAIPTMADIQGVAIWHYDEAKVAPRMASDLMAYSSEATLSDLMVDGTSVNGFTASTFSYAVELPMGTTVVPTVTYTTDVDATAVVTPATDLAGDEAARTTSVVVTSQDGTTEATYTIVFTVATTEVDLNKVNRLSVYPVPATSELFIEGLGKSESLSIIDITGKTVHSEQVTSERMRINISGLDAGIYVILTETSIQKFVKN